MFKGKKQRGEGATQNCRSELAWGFSPGGEASDQDQRKPFKVIVPCLLSKVSTNHLLFHSSHHFIILNETPCFSPAATSGPSQKCSDLHQLPGTRKGTLNLLCLPQSRLWALSLSHPQPNPCRAEGRGKGARQVTHARDQVVRFYGCLPRVSPFLSLSELWGEGGQGLPGTGP